MLCNEFGVDINAQQKVCRTQSDTSNVCPHKWLVCSAAYNMQDGTTPLMMAAQNRHNKIVIFLAKELDVNVNAQDNVCCTHSNTLKCPLKWLVCSATHNTERSNSSNLCCRKWSRWNGGNVMQRIGCKYQHSNRCVLFLFLSLHIETSTLNIAICRTRSTEWIHRTHERSSKWPNWSRSVFGSTSKLWC